MSSYSHLLYFFLRLVIFSVFLTSCAFFLGGENKGIKSELLKANFKSLDWEKVEKEFADYAYKHRTQSAFLVINSLCKRYDSTTLVQLTNSILAGLEELSITKQKKTQIV